MTLSLFPPHLNSVAAAAAALFLSLNLKKLVQYLVRFPLWIRKSTQYCFVSFFPQEKTLACSLFWDARQKRCALILLLEELNGADPEPIPIAAADAEKITWKCATVVRRAR